jgi:hypothetical protein
MAMLFPFGFPWPTAMYLALFVVSMAIYTVFMQYVLAGSIVLLAGYVAALARGGAGTGPVRVIRSGSGLIQKVVCDWLPPVLGLAIATAIAPLLFVQVLYRREFYAASQLLFIRSLLLVLALTIAFLLLYLLRRPTSGGRGPLTQQLAALAASACLLFTAWAWTGIHVLGLHEAAWRYTYTSTRWIYSDAEVWPRLGYWITSSFPTLAVALAWQLRWGRCLHQPRDLDLASRRLKTLALLGLGTSFAEAWLWQLWLEPSARAVVLSAFALPYGLLAFAGMGIQAGCWLSIQSGSQLTTCRLTLISSGAALTILGVLVVREARRLAAIDVATLFEAHSRAAHAPGLSLFLVSLATSTALVAACILIVRRALRALQ